MKRINNLYHKIIAMPNLRKAFYHAKRGKNWYKEVQEIKRNKEFYLEELASSLATHSFRTSPYEKFTVNDNGKEREIYKLPFYPDRICQWAIMQIIEPYLIKNFVKNTYSAIPKRGIHSALYDVKNAIRKDKEGCAYCLKLDVRHFYPSINHRILKQKFRRLFKDKELLWLLDEIVDSINTVKQEDRESLNALTPAQQYEPTGIPIGNYLSQYCGNFYLSSLDHWLKEEKHVKHYFRYMDDIVILDKDKEKLHALRIAINEYLNKELCLIMKKNWQVFPTYIRGIDFVGYRIFDTHILLRKATCAKYKKKMLAIQRKIKNSRNVGYSDSCSVNSYLGWLKHCDSYALQKKYSAPILKYYEGVNAQANC